MFAKSESLVSNTRRSWRANRITTPLEAPEGTRRTSWPNRFNSLMTRTSTPSSISSRMAEGMERNELSLFQQLVGKVQGGSDVLGGHRGIAFSDLLIGLAGLQQLQNGRHHDPGSLEARFSVANGWINRDVILDVHAFCSQPAPGVASDTNRPIPIMCSVYLMLWSLSIKVTQATNEQLYHAVVRYKSGHGSFEDVMAIADQAAAEAVSQ